MFRRVIDRTFNAVSIDTDTSTSDTAAILAERRRRDRSSLGRVRGGARTTWPSSLTRQIARDGEGATTLIEVRSTAPATTPRPSGSRKAIVNSPLVKTAVHGADPNWGRVAMAIGKCSDDTDIDQERVRDPLRRARGLPAPRSTTTTWPSSATYLAGDEVLIHVSLGIADGRVHRLRLRPDRRLRAHQRRLHDLTLACSVQERDLVDRHVVEEPRDRRVLRPRRARSLPNRGRCRDRGHRRSRASCPP